MPKQKKQDSEDFDRFKAFTEALAAVPKGEVDKRARAAKRRASSKRKRKRGKH